MKKILLALLCLPSIALAAQQEIAAVPDSPVLPSIGALKDAVNLRLADIDENFDEIYPIIEAGPVYVNASAPADTKVVWIDTDQSNAIKVYVGGVWTVVGSGGEGSYTLPTAAADTLGGIKVGARLTITDGVLSADVQSGTGAVDSVNSQTGTVVLDADDIDDTSTTNKFVTDAEKSIWDAKQPAIGFTPENAANKGAANGYAGLDAGGKVPSAQLPASYGLGEVANDGGLYGRTYGEWRSLDGVFLQSASAKTLLVASPITKSEAAENVTIGFDFSTIDTQEKFESLVGWGITNSGFVEQASNPTSESPAGIYCATGSGKCFIKSGTGLYDLTAGTYTPDQSGTTCTGIIGTQTAFAPSTPGTGAYQEVTLFDLGCGGQPVSMNATVGAGEFILTIYADNGGEPGDLIWASTQINETTTTAHTITANISGLTLPETARIWLGITVSQGSTYYREADYGTANIGRNIVDGTSTTIAPAPDDPWDVANDATYQRRRTVWLQF